jgi:hypothetical protein
VSLDPIRLAWLSYLIGREKTYLPRYVDEGLPAILPPFDRRMLATYFGIDERDLAGSADMA